MDNTEISTGDQIIAEYDSKKDHYSSLLRRTKNLIIDLLKGSNVNYHSIETRLKSKESLSGKISKLGANYSNLSDVKDIAGIRIITYFSDDVDKIGDIIKKEFKIDRDNSIDKRKMLDPDRFGYLSLHYIASHSYKRATLPEYNNISDLPFEVQIRSILQHSWAEMEHDIGYKSSIEIPKRVKRRFSRVAGLLELADEEFIGLRNEISEYAASVVKEIDQKPKTIEIDSTSLSMFVESNPTVDKIDMELAEVFNAKNMTEYEPGIDLHMLKDSGIQTIKELKDALEEHKDNIPKFAKLWISGSKSQTISKGICLFYLAYILIAQLDDVVRAKTALIGLDMKTEEESFIARLKETYRLVINS